MYRVGRYGLLLFVLILFLTGCTDKSNDPAVTFLYWTETYNDGMQINEWIEEYADSKGKIIEPLPTPIEGYEQKLLILLGAESAPDIFILTPDRFPLYKEKGALYPLNEDFLREELDFPNKEQYPYLYDIEEKFYGVPVNNQVYVIFVRPRDPGECWELFKFLMKKLGVF